MIARLLLGSVMLIAAPVTVGLAAPAAPVSSPIHLDPPSDALAGLFAASDEDQLARSPLYGIFRGDERFGAHMGNLLADAYFVAERDAAVRELAMLSAIDRTQLNAEEQISYDVFKWQRTMDLAGLQPNMLALTVVRPIDHFGGLHALFADINSGTGTGAFKTARDYENGLSRVDDFVAMTDTAVEQMKKGLATNVVQPRLVVDNVVEQLDQLLAETTAESAYTGPIRTFPASMSAADKARFDADYRVSYETKIRPALQRLRDFMVTDYRPKARTSVGLLDMPGGAKLYRHLVAVNTTTDLEPARIHQIGLEEVTRLQGEMEKVKAEVGFTGTLKEFFDHVRTDPKFKPKSREALQQGYIDIGKRVDVGLPRLFRTMPKTALEIRPVPALTEKGAARGSYNSGSEDGTRPGIFYFNAYDLPSRTTPSMETLYLHEGAPGHHFQISLAQENKRLPKFQRFGGNNAYVEGWGLYSETLGKEVGVYTDPYQVFGYLDSQLFRAIRLVVDTGIHTKGWTRDQTIQYILDNSSRGRANAVAETERYIANPGQALSYKIGQLKLSELRARAERALGPKFDIRAFHEQVLMSGALPLAILEQKIDRWIAATIASR
ncbi:MAG: DUF885 family protein [Sphingomicrobium sp.]